MVISPRMLLFCFRASAAIGSFPKPAGSPCPPNTDYHVDKTFEFDVPPKGWYFFYTMASSRGPNMSFDIRSNNNVTLYIQYRSSCPDGTLPPNATIGRKEHIRIPIPVPQDVHVVTSGFTSEEGAHVRVKLVGQRPKQPMHPVLRSMILFAVMAVITAVLFVKCVLPPLKPKTE
jgi:hypothetical protein